MGPISATILGCAGPVLEPAEAAFFADTQPVGFILFARNVQRPAQVKRLTADLRAAVVLQLAQDAKNHSLDLRQDAQPTRSHLQLLLV